MGKVGWGNNLLQNHIPLLLTGGQYKRASALSRSLSNTPTGFQTKMIAYNFINSSPAHRLFSDWNTYLAKACIRAAGQVGGAVSPSSRLSLKVNSKPNPLVPSDLWLLLKTTKTKSNVNTSFINRGLNLSLYWFSWLIYMNNIIFAVCVCICTHIQHQATRHCEYSNIGHTYKAGVCL